MLKKTILRWGGLASLLAGLLFALATVIHPPGEGIEVYDSANWVPAHLLGLASVMLMQVGLVALYAGQVEASGRLGLIGFVLALIGTAFAAAIQYSQSAILPLVAEEAPSIFVDARTPPPYGIPLFVLGLGLGLVLFGIATMRAGVYPRWSGLLLSVGVTLFMIGEVSREAGLLGGMLPYVIGAPGQLLMSAGLIWMGYALWSPEGEVATRRSDECVPQAAS